MDGLKLVVRLFDIDLGKYQVILHEKDAEELGIHSQDRVKISRSDETITAIVDTTDSFIERGQVGVFFEVQQRLELTEGNTLKVVPADKPASVAYIRKKMEGKDLSREEIDTLIRDVVDGSLTDIELAAYVTSIQIRDMNLREVEDLTNAMVKYGEVIDFEGAEIFDKHSIGGVPGNKISLLVVPIVAAAGLLIPKTSSRAVTGAAGTADIMELFCNVRLSAEEIKRITLEVGGVLSWGGGVNLAPADDIIIRVEHPLSLDPRSQLLASVMAKKKAVGARNVVIDLPMGEGTKIVQQDEARKIARDFIDLGERLGMKVECAITYGGQPVGKAIGPALEANEALLALNNGDAPQSLVEKSVGIAGMLLEMGGVTARGKGRRLAQEILESGKALQKFDEIVIAQGGMKPKEQEIGRHSASILAPNGGYLTGVANRRLVHIARLAGAPKDGGAGVVLHKKRGDKVDTEEPLLTIYSSSEYNLKTALAEAKRGVPVTIEGMVLQRVPDFQEF